MKIALIFLSILFMIFGILLLVFSLAVPNWYIKNWKKLINHNPPNKLQEYTITVGTIILIFGIILLIM